MLALGQSCSSQALIASAVSPILNIDSMQASNAQDSFKKPSCAIRLLRVGKVPPTFSTTSTKSRHEFIATANLPVILVVGTFGD
jgi:hypothetical protein